MAQMEKARASEKDRGPKAESLRFNLSGATKATIARRQDFGQAVTATPEHIDEKLRS